jgi:hypothetical protein
MKKVLVPSLLDPCYTFSMYARVDDASLNAKGWIGDNSCL